MAEALAAGRVVYTESWWRDCFFYICNNHVLLSVFCAHPEHPYSRCRRLLVLLNSLCFAFFLTAILHAVVPFELAQGFLEATLGTVLQVIFDLPSSMMGSCK